MVQVTTKRDRPIRVLTSCHRQDDVPLASKSGESGSIGFVRVLRTSVDEIYSACLMERPWQQRLADEQPLRRLHNRFNRAISKHHPNIWLFIRAIQQEQAATELLHQQLTAGRPGRRTKKAYIAALKNAWQH